MKAFMLFFALMGVAAIAYYFMGVRFPHDACVSKANDEYAQATQQHDLGVMNDAVYEQAVEAHQAQLAACGK